MKAQISDTLLKELLAIPAGQNDRRVYDTSVKGFYAERHGEGFTFWVMYPDQRGRRRFVRIGRYRVVAVGQARRKALEIRGRAALGENPKEALETAKAMPTIGRFLAEWYVPDCRQRSLAPNYHAYVKRITAQLGKHALDELTTVDVHRFQKWLLDQGLSNGTVNRHIAALRSALGLAIRLGMLKGGNPAASPRMLREEHRIARLSQMEARGLFAALSREHDRVAAVALQLLALTGARRDEILHAQWENVDLGTGTLTVPRSKSGRPRQVILSAAAQSILQDLARHREPGQGWLFPRRDGNGPRIDIRGAWTRARTAAGLPSGLRIHDIRHAYASALADSGVPLGEIATLLGHSDVRVTAKYAHYGVVRLQNTVDALASGWGQAPNAPHGFVSQNAPYQKENRT